jgi:hypothetical protein
MRAAPTTTAIIPHSIFTSVTSAPEVDVGARVWLDDVVADETFVDVIDDNGDVWVVVPDDVCVVLTGVLLVVAVDWSTFRGLFIIV